MTSQSTKPPQLPKWLRYAAAAYMKGKGISLGIPNLIDGPLFPQLAHEGTAFELSVGSATLSHVTGESLEIFAPNVFDHIVVGVGHPKLSQAIDKLMLGGHLIQIGPAQLQFDVPYGTWVQKIDTHEGEWRIRILKRVGTNETVIRVPEPKAGRKRVCIARYGAIGDALQLTPIIHQLHDEGYDVTLNVSPYTVDIYKNNPYVANIVTQERNVIPNPDLGEYWDYWKRQYDRYINFSESIEGKLLKVEGRSDFYTTKEWRHANCNVNYHDQHMKLAGIEDSKYKLPELYFTKSEEKDLLYDIKPLREADQFVIAWGLKGSSHHKLYAFLPEVAKAWLNEHPDSHILTIGGAESVNLKINHDRIIPLLNVWPIRKSMLLTKYVDLVIGPESAITNASSCFDTPKIVLLSHSTHDNLTKHWTNVQALAPDEALAPCYPCHQLHYTLPSCPLIDIQIDRRKMTNLPKCAAAVEPERVYDAIEKVYLEWKAKRQSS